MSSRSPRARVYVSVPGRSQHGCGCVRSTCGLWRVECESRPRILIDNLSGRRGKTEVGARARRCLAKASESTPARKGAVGWHKKDQKITRASRSWPTAERLRGVAELPLVGRADVLMLDKRAT